MSEEKLTVKRLLEEMERSAVGHNRTYDVLRDAWDYRDPKQARQNIECCADQVDLSDVARILVAERNLARAEAELANAKLRLARKAADVLASGSGSADLLGDSLRSLSAKE